MKIYLGVFLVVILFGCNNSTKRNKEGITVSRTLNDSTKVFLKLGSDDSVIDSVAVVNGEKHGIRKTYDIETGYTRYLNYHRGEVFGVDSTVTEEGVNILHCFNLKGETVGGRILCDEAGDLKLYQFLGLDSAVFYHRKYEKDTLISSIGNPFASIDTTEKINNDTIIIRAGLAVPPECEAYFIICEVSQVEGSSMCNSKKCCELYDVPPEGNLIGDFKFLYKFKQKGRVSLVFKYLIVDNKTKKEEVTRKRYEYEVE